MRPIRLLLLASLLLISGCLDDDGSGDTDPGDDGNKTAPPDPLVITGSAQAPNPAADGFCVQQGVDGEVHELGREVDGWDYALEPTSFKAYWYDADGYLGNDSAGSSGTVPAGAEQVEVCATAEAGDYTLTITPPEEEAAEADKESG